MTKNLVRNDQLKGFLSERMLEVEDLNTMVGILEDTGGLNMFGQIYFPGTQLFIEQTEDDRFMVDGEKVYTSPRNAVLAAIKLFDKVTDWSE